jgi:short-subunit dehydrogenase
MSQRSVLITGCSSGIGRALAEVFQQADYQVWATARKDQDLATLSEAGFNTIKLDVNDGLGLGQLAERLKAEIGSLDVLINNAGYGAIGVTRALFPLLRQNKGLVVNIGSVSGVLVTPFAGAYCASKAAVHALSDALRMELAPFAIEVMEVQPGAIASSFGANASQQAELLIDQASPWWPIREGIRARANASQDNPTPASHFARNLLAAVQRKRRPNLIRLGNGSRSMPLLAALVPKRLMESILKKRFGLNRSL